MANTKTRLDEIDRQAGDLAVVIKKAIDELTGQLSSLNERYRRLTGSDAVTVAGASRRVGRPKGSKNNVSGNNVSGSAASSETKTAAPKKKKRIRRTREQLKVMADDIFSFVKKSGGDGVKGSAIKKEFGVLLPSIKEFLKTYGGKTIKTKGQKAAMTYHHD